MYFVVSHCVLSKCQLAISIYFKRYGCFQVYTGGEIKEIHDNEQQTVCMSREDQTHRNRQTTAQGSVVHLQGGREAVNVILKAGRHVLVKEDFMISSVLIVSLFTLAQQYMCFQTHLYSGGEWAELSLELHPEQLKSFKSPPRL